jgi:hypothetical protein
VLFLLVLLALQGNPPEVTTIQAVVTDHGVETIPGELDGLIVPGRVTITTTDTDIPMPATILVLVVGSVGFSASLRRRRTPVA